jgi:hypothetical protein
MPSESVSMNKELGGETRGASSANR